jgi:hypothetical protein
MSTIDKPESIPTSSLRGEIPAAVMEKLQAAYQASGYSSTQRCPDPETVIGYALEELIPEKRGQVYAHLSECKDCLDLVLDLRSAGLETQGGENKVWESAPIRVQPQSWLARLVERIGNLDPRRVPLPRLIPIGVALLVLAVGIGVLQRLTAPTSGQPPLTMTNLKADTAYNHREYAIDKAGIVFTGLKARNKGQLPFLPLLLKN